MYIYFVQEQVKDNIFQIMTKSDQTEMACNIE